MPNDDQWGHDPNVQMMRQIFALLEKSQKELLEAMGISLFDPRLKRARHYSRDLFEQSWPVAMQKGIVTNENETSLLYQHCLVLALKWSGIKVQNLVLPDNDRIARFVQEKLR